MYNYRVLYSGNLIWRSREKKAKLKTANIKPRDPDSLVARGTESSNLKSAKFKNGILGEIAKFNARHIFPLYGIQ